MLFSVSGEPAKPVQLAEWLALATFPVCEIQRADSGDPHKHQDSGEQDDYYQGSLLVLPERQQLCRQALTALLINAL
jgi:hypothetical protein